VVLLKIVFKIYLISNLQNEKIYIGRTRLEVRDRWKQHVWDSRKAKFYFSRAIKKHGPENFRYRILRRTESEIEARELETQYIFLSRSYDPDYGYNSTFGGEGAGIPTIETRLKQRARMIGSRHFLWGRHRSHATKLKLRKANLGVKSPVYRTDLNTQEIVRLYLENNSLRAIGKLLNADSHTISDRLEKHGIKRRPHWKKFWWKSKAIKPKSETKEK
jgi:group I intron endonuclease